MATAFQLQEVEPGITLITFDLPNKKVNTFSRAVMQELGQLLFRLQEQKDLRGILFASGKPDQFIAGADLNELGALAYATADQVTESIVGGHQVFNLWSKLPPSVALVAGPCMGGGTELILALDERIVADHPKVQIALPETKLGIIPGWGGTQRLPRLIGMQSALEMITSGESIGAQRAVELGLAFDAVPPAQLLAEGLRFLKSMLADDTWQQHRQQRAAAIEMTENARLFLKATAEGYLQQKTKGQYPAPMVALQAILEGSAMPLPQGLKREQELCQEVFGTPISANLVRVFFLNQRLERDPGVTDRTVQPRSVQRVGVIGAGLMGAGIAAAHARRQLPTVLLDLDEARVAAGVQRARAVVESRIAIGRADVADLADLLVRLTPTTDQAALKHCDLIIEAVVEDEQVKRDTFASLRAVVAPDTIIASNTSTVSITRLAEAAPDPSRFLGMHFFNPVDRMQLVEVIRGQQTSDETVATVVALAKQIRKIPIVVNDCPGFLVNRCLLPYMNEALQLLLEGVEMDTIDQAAERFGMPMGPIALHDLIGLDTALYAGRVMAKAYRDRANPAPLGLLQQMVQAGRFGEKSGRGFRQFGKKGKPSTDPDFTSLLAQFREQNAATSSATNGSSNGVRLDENSIIDRLFLPMFLEATRCLEEQIVREPGDVDMGLILGIGFPPFRGGILRWAEQEGLEQIANKLDSYAKLGKRYEPTTGLMHILREQGGLFYPVPKVMQPV